MVNSKGFRNLLTTSIEKHGEAANVVHGIADTMRNLASLDDGEAITSIADVTIVKARPVSPPAPLASAASHHHHCQPLLVSPGRHLSSPYPRCHQGGAHCRIL